MVRLRQILFYSFAAIYLVACPLVLSSAFGVAWAPGVEGGLERTGLLSISTIPSEAAVYVGNRRYKDRTPMLLRGLQPGVYPVQVALKGYRPWLRDLSIQAGRATVLDRLVLLPQRGAFKTRTSESFEALLPVPGSSAMILVPAQARLGDMQVYSARHESLRPLLPADSPWVRASLRIGLSVPESRHMLWRVATDEGERYFWISPERAEGVTQELTRLMLGPPDAVQWDARRHSLLWVLRGQLLDRVDPEQQTVSPAVVLAVRGMAVHEGLVTLVDAAGRLARVSEAGERLGPLPEKHQPDTTLLASAGHVELVALGEGLWLMRDERGRVVINRPAHPMLAVEILGMAAHPSEPVAVLWNHQQVGVVDATPLLGSAESPAPVRVRWLATGRRQVERVFWIAEGDHLVMQEGTTLSLLQLWRTPYVTIDRLLDLKLGTQAAWPEGSGALHYLDPATGHLMTLELIPERYFSLLRFRRPRVELPAAGP
jgi:hypothetical protein